MATKPRQITITLNKTLPSWNMFYAGVHPYKRKRLADEWHAYVWGEARDQLHRSVEPFTNPVDVVITLLFPKGKRRIDVDNVCSKLAIDGLKEILLSNDSAKYVESVTTRCQRWNGEEKTVIELTEVAHA